MELKGCEFIGVSFLGVEEAIKDALLKAGDPERFELIETYAQGIGADRHYQVVVATYPNL